MKFFVFSCAVFTHDNNKRIACDMLENPNPQVFESHVPRSRKAAESTKINSSTTISNRDEDDDVDMRDEIDALEVFGLFMLSLSPFLLFLMIALSS